MNIKYLSSKAFSLVELMITLVLSLLITYAIAQVLISSNRSSATSDGMSQSQETGRFIMSFLARQIRQAGLDSIESDRFVAAPFVSCSEFPALVVDNACITENPGGEDQDSISNNGIHGDRLAISLVLPAGNLIDCTGSTGYIPNGGTTITPYEANDTIINTFWVEADAATGASSLRCKGFLFDGTDVLGASTAQSIANGVEAMQILYGEADDALPSSGNRNISHYIPAPVDPAAPTAIEVTNWDRVYAVKISLLTRSIADVTNSNTLRTYILANAEPYEMTDAVSRQVFTTTFVINNYK